MRSLPGSMWAAILALRGLAQVQSLEICSLGNVDLEAGKEKAQEATSGTRVRMINSEKTHIYLGDLSEV